MKTIEISDDAYELLQVMKENSVEELTDDDVVKFMIHQISMDIEAGIL